MAALHNRVSKRELKQRLEREETPRVTISFYQYFFIEDPRAFRDALYRNCFDLQVFGRIYIAPEGINAQVSVPADNLEKFRSYLLGLPGLEHVRLNVALDNSGKSFWMLKVKVRSKIVADGIRDAAFDMRNKGRYVDARTFNEMTADPGTIVVDMRNHYEYEVGHFDNAIEIPSDTFREQLPMAVAMLQDKKDRNIIMYCTGGIRCEKASAWLLHNGFGHVYHLEGGIIHYANTARDQQLPNKFRGKNFVFDGRLGETVGQEVISTCHQCGQPCDTHTNCANDACHLLFIQCADCAKTYGGCCSAACREIVSLPEAERRRLRKGVRNPIMFFHKSRQRANKPA